MINLAWLTAARDRLAQGDWPERIDGPDGFLTVTYAAAPGHADDHQMVATLHGWDDSGRAYDLEITPGVTVPLDDVKILL